MKCLEPQYMLGLRVMSKKGLDAYIQIFNYGNCRSDFTYVDDIVEGIVRMMQGAPERKNADATALERDFGFTPKITLREGLRHFAEWYAEFYGTRS